MVVTVLQQWCISYNDPKNTMPVPDYMLKYINGETYLKLRGSFPPLCRLICSEGRADMPRNPTLHDAVGLKQLKDLRNLASGSPVDVPENVSKLMADAEVVPSPKRKQRKRASTTAVQIEEVLKLALPSGEILVARANHPNEDLVVRMEPDNLDRVFDYVREFEVDFTKKKRGYVKSGKFTGGRTKHKPATEPEGDQEEKLHQKDARDQESGGAKGSAM